MYADIPWWTTIICGTSLFNFAIDRKLLMLTVWLVPVNVAANGKLDFWFWYYCITFIPISATVTLRLLLIGVPVMSQKLVAKQSQYKKELDEFRCGLIHFTVTVFGLVLYAQRPFITFHGWSFFQLSKHIHNIYFRDRIQDAKREGNNLLRGLFMLCSLVSLSLFLFALIGHYTWT